MVSPIHENKQVTLLVCFPANEHFVPEVKIYNIFIVKISCLKINPIFVSPRQVEMERRREGGVWGCGCIDSFPPKVSYKV